MNLELLMARYYIDLSDKLGFSYIELTVAFEKFKESLKTPDDIRISAKKLRETIGDQDIISRIGYRKPPVSMTIHSRSSMGYETRDVEVGQGISETGGPRYETRDLNSVTYSTILYEWHLMVANDPQYPIASKFLNEYNTNKAELYLFGESDNNKRINEYLKVFIYRILRGDSLFQAEKTAYDHLKIYGFISHVLKQLLFLYPIKDESEQIPNEKFDKYYKKLFECLVKIILEFSNDNLGTNFNVDSYKKLITPPSKMLADGWIPSDPLKPNKLPIVIGLGAFLVAGILMARK